MINPAQALFNRGFASWSRMLSKSTNRRATLTVIADEAVRFVAKGCPKQLAIDEVTERAISRGIDPDVVQATLAAAFEPAAPQDNGRANGKHAPHAAPEPPPMTSRDDYRNSGKRTNDGSGPQNKPILTIAEWLERDLPPADPVLGHWLTTTSRVLLTAPTGLGKPCSA
jgi:hypothetical protein